MVLRGRAKMSAVEAVDKFMRELVVEDGVTAEELAPRMFYWQMEIYSAHAGGDLYKDGDFEELSAEDRAGWVAIAQKKLAGELT